MWEEQEAEAERVKYWKGIGWSVSVKKTAANVSLNTCIKYLSSYFIYRKLIKVFDYIFSNTSARL